MEKINIAELLKDCPSGMELDCVMYENVTLLDVHEGYDFPIKISTPEGKCVLSQYGCYSLNKEAKCVIFPKGKTTWEGFQRPFKDGDVVATSNGAQIFIFKENAVNNGSGFSGVCYFGYKIPETQFFKESRWRFSRHATEEEKQKLFKAIRYHGYKWNAEKKTLEKVIEPKFKVGDRIIKRNSISNPWIVSSVSSEYYELKLSKGSENIGVLPICEQDDYELLSNKFDIATLVPFKSKVLVRQLNGDYWRPAFWGCYNKQINPTYPFLTTFGTVRQCVPYKGNKHLLGTTDDCDEYYKTWEE